MSEDVYTNLLELLKKFPAASDYLSTIFLINRDYGEVHNTQLAQRLGVSKPAVSQAIVRLKKLKLLEKNPSGLIKLSSSGKQLAADIIKRHYLMEHLLISHNFPWDKADEEALRLQSVISHELTEHLFTEFKQPQSCPHGNPFPGSDLEDSLLKAPRLNELAEKTAALVLRITEEGEGIQGLLNFCYKNSISPGLEIQVLQNLTDHYIQIQDAHENEILIPWTYSAYICVKIIS